MKLCWDNLESLRYVGNNTWHRETTNHYFICKDACVGCGEEFIAYKYDEAKYCSNTCARIYNNPMKNNEVRKRHKAACNKYEHCKKISDHHKGKKRPDQSEFMKKNNTMFDKYNVRKHADAVSSDRYKRNMSIIIKKRWQDDQYRLRYEQSLLKKGLKKPDHELEELERYRRKVKTYTNRSIKKFFNKVNPNNYPIGIGDGFYNIDHIYSIVDGFENNVLPKIIGSYINLQVIPSKENILKYSNSWISKSELIRRFHACEDSV